MKAAVFLAFVAVPIAFGPLCGRVVASSFAITSQKAKPRCKTVTKKIHGKKHRVKVCQKPKPKPKPKPTPRPPAQKLFSSPTGIAVDDAGNVYVADNGDKDARIQELSAAGKVVAHFGSSGTGPGQLRDPNLMATDKSGNVYVADTANNRVGEFSPQGQLLKEVGTQGTGAGQFDTPYGVGVTKEGDILVADTLNNRVQKLSPSGTSVASWQPALSLMHPSGIALDSSGDVIVSASKDDVVYKLSANGQLLDKWGSEKGIQKPTGVAVDQADDVYIVERVSGKVFEISPTGTLLHSWGGIGENAGQFTFASRTHMNGIAIDKQGNVYVADTGNNRLQRLAAGTSSFKVWP